GLPETRRPALPGNLQADVAIIGAGYTGLWTAYYLRKAAPQLRVVVLEKEFAGFGASGRNGGWCMGVMAWDQNRYAATHGREAVLDMVSALEGAVPEIAQVCAAEGIDADLRETEELMIAANPAQVAKAKENPKLAGWFVGQVMKATGGKANPKAVTDLVAQKLAES
ncbi:MAG: FAD-dependent oxidoreductase, partial [Pseudomonadota bacterium]|nr:FAD-dependent oxidoreductase [Pseudomonadota bacterium]